MKIEKGTVRAYSLEESKRLNVLFEEVQQIDEKGVEHALLCSLNCDREFIDRMFYRVEIHYAELSHIEDEYKVYGFGYAFCDKLIVKIMFNFDVNNFYENSVQIEKRFEEV